MYDSHYFHFVQHYFEIWFYIIALLFHSIFMFLYLFHISCFYFIFSYFIFKLKFRPTFAIICFDFCIFWKFGCLHVFMVFMLMTKEMYKKEKPLDSIWDYVSMLIGKFMLNWPFGINFYFFHITFNLNLVLHLDMFFVICHLFFWQTNHEAFTIWCTSLNFLNQLLIHYDK